MEIPGKPWIRKPQVYLDGRGRAEGPEVGLHWRHEYSLPPAPPFHRVLSHFSSKFPAESWPIPMMFNSFHAYEIIEMAGNKISYKYIVQVSKKFIFESEETNEKNFSN